MHSTKLVRAVELSFLLGNTTEAAHTHPHPQNSRYTLRCPSVVLWTPCSGLESGCVRTDHQGLEKRHTRKQPVNLAVEAAEESLSILPDYTPTVRPPPTRC
jgi:hypothetical protein